MPIDLLASFGKAADNQKVTSQRQSGVQPTTRRLATGGKAACDRRHIEGPEPAAQRPPHERCRSHPRWAPAAEYTLQIGRSRQGGSQPHRKTAGYRAPC